MISPHTPPGTHVVALENRRGLLPDLELKRVYVVESIAMCLDLYTGANFAGVRLVGVDHDICGFFGFVAFRGACYCLEQFEYAVLPKALTELLTKEPTPELLREHVEERV